MFLGEIIILNLQDFKNYLDDLFPAKTGTSSSYLNAIKRVFKYLNINMEEIIIDDVEKIKQFKIIMDDKESFEKKHYIFISEAKSYYYKGFISRSIIIFINWSDKHISFDDVAIVNNNLKQSFSLVNIFNRSNKVKNNTLERADGYCELCFKEAPFIDKKGKPYLEVHHVVYLSDDGLDSTDNTLALCPNCHMKLHHGKELTKSEQQIINKILTK